MDKIIGYDSNNPYSQEASRMCNTLVNEVALARTWADMQDAIAAIHRVRSREKSAAAEWEHLNNPSPKDNCCGSDPKAKISKGD